MKARNAFLLFMLAGVWVNAIAQVPFATLIGEEAQSYNEAVYRSVPTSDGGVIAAIRIAEDDKFMMKLDADGQPLWSYGYAMDSTDLAYVHDLVATADGGAYMMLELRTQSSGPGFGEVPLTVITRIDGNGTPIWSKRFRMPPMNPFDTPSFEAMMILLQNGDLQVTFFGFAAVFTGPAHTFRIDPNGTVQWAMRETMGQGADRNIVREGSDGGILLMQMSHADTYPIRLTRFAPEGAVLWNKQVRMTNASWSYYPGGFLLTTSGDSYIIGEQLASPSVLFPFLIKVDPAGDLEWYRVYGDGTGVPIMSSHPHGIQLPNTDLQFGLLSTSTFTVDGEHLSTVVRNAPSWISGAYSFSLPNRSVPVGQSAALVHGSLTRFDNTFSTTWTTPFLSRMDLTAPLDCGWAETTAPLSNDSIAPAEFIDYQDGVAWTGITVDVADTAVTAIPVISPTIAPYCAPVGITEEHTVPGGLTVFPSVLGSGTSVNIQTKTTGQLSILDATGRAVRGMRLLAGSATAFTTDGMASGMYTVQLIRDDGAPTNTARFVIER